MVSTHDAVQQLWAAVLGEDRRQTGSFEEVLAALDAGGDPLVELPWYPDGSTHQIVLKERMGDEVRFYDPDGGGIGSLPLADLADRFARGGWGLVPDSRS